MADGGSTTESLREWQIGDVVDDRYEIRERLGEGGFAVVWLGFDRVIERPVAIKVLWPQLITGPTKRAQEVMRRFLREAKAAARIRHPGIVEIYDFGTVGEIEAPYIVMEQLRGHGLETELYRRGPMSPDRLLPLYSGVLKALDQVHREGIVHKDLKPENLFLAEADTRDEMLKIVDFGIAHVEAPNETRLTAMGSVTGTPHYLPPEYIEHQQISPAMDIYQAGLILVEALSAKPVVEGDGGSMYKIALKHVERDFNIPPQLQRGEIGAIIDRALAYDAEDRFETARQFAEALEGLDPADVPVLGDGQTQSASASEEVIPTTSAETLAETLFETRSTHPPQKNYGAVDETGQTELGVEFDHPEVSGDVDDSMEGLITDGRATVVEGEFEGVDENAETELELDLPDPVDDQRIAEPSAPEDRLGGPTRQMSTARMTARIDRPSADDLSRGQRRRRWIAAGVVAVLVAAAALGVLMFVGDDSEKKKSADEAAVDQIDDEPLTEEQLLAQLERRLDDPGDDEDRPPPVRVIDEEEPYEPSEDTRVIELFSEPPEAVVRDYEGEALGTTPIELELQRQEIHQIQVTYSGYFPRILELDDDTDDHVEVTLSRRSARE